METGAGLGAIAGATAGAGTGNPYVGPRTFRKDEAGRFFGRESEARDLLALVVAERLVLFYAQSGAGKSSLINTRLIPGLEKKGFEVLPSGRVSGELPAGAAVENLFIYNLMLSLEQSKQGPERFQHLRLAEFLANLGRSEGHFYYQAAVPSAPAEEAPAAAAPGQAALESAAGGEGYEILPRALIIDQFEELFSSHPEAWEQREDFLRQISEAMEADPYLWVLLAMREDYVAGLDPYVHLLPGKLRARYYMQRMGTQAALEAVCNPVKDLRPFETQAAGRLVDNLRLTSAAAPGSAQAGTQKLVTGEFIEPVQLQVVCYQLWETLKREPGPPGATITEADLEKLAHGEDLAQFVNNALADFYEQAIARVLSEPGLMVSERELRDWFSNQLITEAETRGFVYQGEEKTGSLPNQAVALLASQFIIRSEAKAGGTWYELVHDRFISPILQANRKWRAAHQNPLALDAAAWQAAGKDRLKLYDGNKLKAAQAYAEQHPEGLSPLEKEFVNSSVESARRQNASRQRIILLIAGALILIFAGLSAFAFSKEAQTRRNAVDMAIQGTAISKSILRWQGVAATSQQEAAQMSTRAAQLEALAGTLASVPTSTPVIQGVVAPETRPATGQGQATATSRTVIPIRPTLSLDTPRPILIPTQPAVQPSATPTLHQTIDIGHTVKDNILYVERYGYGPKRIVLVGGLHSGYAPGTVFLAEKAVRYFSGNLAQIPANVTLDILTNMNPDSLFAPGLKTGRLNANGVDLNRNWDCNWRQDAVWRSEPINGGRAPFSEPETKVLSDFILKEPTVAVVFWEAKYTNGLVSPGGCGPQSLFSDPLAKLYGDAAGYPAAPFEAYTVNGDGTNWLDAQGIPAVSVLLPDYASDDWANNLKGIQALLAYYSQGAAQ